MDVRLHARKTDLNDRLRETAQSKVAHAARFFDNIGDADVEFSEEQNPRLAGERHRVEISASAAGKFIRVEAAAGSAESALDMAVDKFSHQLRRLKEKLIDRSRKARPMPEELFSAEVEEEPEIVRVKQFVMKPMTPEEAALQMELLGHSFFFFQNAESDLASVLYRRRDGAYGLIEPA